jgi:hypothetical protein
LRGGEAFVAGGGDEKWVMTVMIMVMVMAMVMMMVMMMMITTMVVMIWWMRGRVRAHVKPLALESAQTVKSNALGLLVT